MYRIFVVFLLISAFFANCGLNFKRGNGEIEISEFEIEGFHKIYVGGNYDLTLIPSNQCRVVIQTDENLLDYINVEEYEGALNINNVHRLKSSNGINIQVFYKNIDQIYSTGASRITHEGILETEELDIDLSGAGSVNLDIDVKQVKIQMSGAGIIELSGNTDLQESHISGAGGLMAEGLRSKVCDVNLSGLGGASVYVTEKLEASITGIGGITYSGNPQLIEKQVTGLGKIIRNEEFIDMPDDSEI